ncbi:MAG: peptide chain release factor N(5)-glutamine methyltransferase [Acetobacteraceae bacterium]
MSLTVRQAIGIAASRLSQAGIDNPRLEARLLLAHALGVAVEDLLRDPDAPVAEARFQPLLARREAHEPLALIVGHREFWSLDFVVSSATLIPRADSETLVEAALAAFAGRPPPRRVLDLGTGTGCLLLAVLSEFPAAFGIGVDRVPAAAALAARNAAALHLADRTGFLCGDWADALDARFDLVLCNPPYIATAEIGRLMPEVADFEPLSALDGGADGFAAWRRLLPALPRLIGESGVAVMELGAGQAPMAADLARRAGLAGTAVADLGGIPRALVMRHTSP